MSNEKTYWSREAATLLGIGTSTLRKWSIELEKAEYSLIRDENDKRAYFDKDILALRDMQTFINKGMTLENAANAVMAKLKRQAQAGIVLVEKTQKERSSEVLSQADKLKNELVQMQQNFLTHIEEGFVQRLREEIRAEVRQELELQLEDKMERLERLIKDEGERHDHVLMENIRKMQEDAQNQVAATEKKRSWWPWSH